MISQDKINEVIQKTDIVDLVSQFISLEKYGSGFRGLCPFHPDHSPSFSVSPDKKIAKCMVCGEGGNPINFLRKIKNISFAEAVKELADKAGVTVDGVYINQNKDDYSHLHQIMETSKKFYIHNLWNTKSGQEALDYLHKRGIDDETIKRFEIGLSLNTPSSLYQVLKEQNYNELDMIQLGLIKQNDNEFYDLFRNRIMFPVKNEAGNTIAYSARIFNNSDKTQAKYVNSPETPIFKKHLTLFNLSEAILSIRKLHRVILHEGQMDVIAGVRSGNLETVCSMGTALTKDQVAIIKKYTNNVLLCYDGDKAGIEAMVKAIKLFERQNINVKLVILPNKDDPDSYVLKYGPDKFRDYLENNQLEPLDFIFSYATLGKDFTAIKDIEDAKDKLFTNLKDVKSTSAVELYISKLAALINVSTASLMMDFNNYYTLSYPENNGDILDVSVDLPTLKNNYEYLRNYAWAELRLLNYAKIDKTMAENIENSFPNHDIRPYLEPIHQEIWDELILDYYMQFDNFTEQLFLDRLNDRLHTCYLQNITSLNKKGDKYVPYTNDDMSDCIEKLKEHYVESKIMKLDEKIGLAQGKDKIMYLSEKVNLLKQLDNMRNVKKN